MISIIVSAGFACSVLYNYGYFYALGTPLHSLPLTLTDYSETTLLWSLSVSGVYCAWLLIELTLRRIEGGITEEEIIQSTSNPEKTRKFRESPYKFGKWLMILLIFYAIICYILFGSNYDQNTYFYAISSAWLIFSSWLNNTPAIIEKRNKLTIKLIIYTPLVALFMLYYGYYSATSNFSKPTSTSSKYFLYTNSSAKRKQVDILRMLNKGVLVYSNKNVTFYNWSDIKKIAVTSQKNIGYEGILCKLFNEHCPTPNFHS